LELELPEMSKNAMMMMMIMMVTTTSTILNYSEPYSAK